MDTLTVEIDWDQLSVGSNESFFHRHHPTHEPKPLPKKTLLKSAIEKWSQDVDQQMARQSRAPGKESKPVAAIRPRGKSLPRKPPATIPVTPNVLKKRIHPLTSRAPFRKEPEPYVFKAKPAPLVHKGIHKSCSALNNGAGSSKAPTTTKPAAVKTLTKDLNRMTVNVRKVPGTAVAPKRTVQNKENAQPPNTVSAPERHSRSQVKKADQLLGKPVPQPRVRSTSAPRATTVPVTPMVLKRNASRSRTRTLSNQNAAAASTQATFKAKPADVLHRKPFKPKLGANGQADVATQPPVIKQFAFSLEGRLKDRQTFNTRTGDALEKKQKLVHEAKLRTEDERYKAARKLTVFKANPNPFK